MDYDLDNRIIKVDIDNNDVEKYRRLVGILDLESEANVARRVKAREASLNQCAEHKHQAGQTVIQNDIMAHPSRLNSVIARAVDGSKFKLEWYHKNYLDHVYAVSDDDGDILEHYRYTAFGEVQIYNAIGNQVATTQINNHILWNTRRRDELTGYYMYKYRHYSAELGRWPSRDPLGEAGGHHNLYTYSGNDSINLRDELGLRSLPSSTKTAKYTIGIVDPKTKKIKGTKIHNVKYRFGLVSSKDCTLNVVIPITFVTGAQSGMNAKQKKELRDLIKNGGVHNQFKAGIDKAWNNKFKFCCNCEKCPNGYKIVIGLKIVKQGGWTVALTNTKAKVNSNQLLWNLSQGAGRVAAHEVGHMIGMPDEYLGPIKVGNKWTDFKAEDGGSIMVKASGSARARHFGKIKAQFKKSGCQVVKQGAKCPGK